MYQPSIRQNQAWETIRSDWNFDTVQSSSAMGTYRTMRKDLDMPLGMVPDEDPGALEEVHGYIDSGAATKGSDPKVVGTGMNSQAAHSTVIIKPTRMPSLERGISEPDMVSQDEAPDGPDDAEAEAPLGAPLASSSASVRSNRQASYMERVPDGAGTVLRKADFGTGVDTIGPVTPGSLRLSAESVGNMCEDSNPTSSTSPTKHSRASSQVGKAGTVLIDEVVLPILQNVRQPLHAKSRS